MNAILKKQYRPFSGFSKKMIAAILFGLSIVAAFGVWHYRFHLIWICYNKNYLRLQNIRVLPDRLMPVNPIPSDWLRCRVGYCEFSLPPDLATNQVAQEKGSTSVLFQSASRAVMVSTPTEICVFPELLAAVSKLSCQSQAFTLPQLRRKCYQSSPNDFRWSMTPNEVRLFCICMGVRKLIDSETDRYTETLLREDLDGIAVFRDNLVVFDWQSKTSAWNGYIHFIDEKENRELFWIRTVCQSLVVP
jgi:hypothetical protein